MNEYIVHLSRILAILAILFVVLIWCGIGVPVLVPVSCLALAVLLK